MKKNILTIIILASTLVNLVLSAVIVFVVVPTSSRTNKLIGDVASLVSLDVGQDDSEEVPDEVPFSDLESYKIESAKNINLKTSSDGKIHYARLTETVLYLNTKAKDYKEVTEIITKNESKINDIVSDVVVQYSIENASNSRDQIKDEVLKRVQALFESETVYDISLDITFT